MPANDSGDRRRPQADAPAARASGENHGPIPVYAPGPLRPAVLPVLHAGPRASITVAVIGRPSFRRRLCAILEKTSFVDVLFDREGPVTNGLSDDPGIPRVVVIDGETAHHLAQRAPTINRSDVLANLAVLLVADPAEFEPPSQVGAVVGERWSVLLASSAENPLRLARAIERAADRRGAIDPGIDRGLVRVTSDLTRLRRRSDD